MDLSRNIILEIDLNTGHISTTANNYFYNTDRNIAYFYIKLYSTDAQGEKQYIGDTNSAQYKVYITTIKPKTITPIKLLGERVTNSDIDNNVVYKITIPNDLMKQQGFVYCEGQVIYNNQELTTDCFSFKINPDKLTEYNLTLITDPDLPVLQDLINQIKHDVRGIDDTKTSDSTVWSSEYTNAKFNEVNAQVNKINDHLKNINVIMPESSNVDENTTNLQTILNLAKNKNVNLTVEFPSGYYQLKPCTIFDNTTIKLTNNTTLKSVAAPYYNKNFNVNEDIHILFFNAIPHDDNELNITGYNGRSNITIDGGILDVESAICFIHGQNITLKNITFKNADYDHYMQIGSCKNVKIENCEFYGVTARESNRQYVEFIQIDWATFESMPYWRKDGAIFDNGVNDGIEIINCKFSKGEDNYNYLPTAIGSHAGRKGVNNKNITIKNCEFNQCDYASITLKYMDGVVIEDNKFLSTDNQNSYGITIDCCKNVNVGKGNYFTGNARGISIYNSCENLNLNNFTMESITHDSDMILMGESKYIFINGVTFRNCHSKGSIILSRNNSYVSINNCNIFECSAGSNFFANIYVKGDGTSTNVDVSNNKVSFAEVYFNPSVANVKRTKEQFLWSGAAQSGTITLSDDIEKYQNLMANCDIYGIIALPLVFIENKCVLKTFNIPDSGDAPGFSLFEIPLTIDGRTITIGSIRELNYSNGTAKYVENSNSFYLKEIKGIKFRV